MSVSTPSPLLYTVDQNVQAQIDKIHNAIHNEPLVLGELINILTVMPNKSAEVRFEFNNHTFDDELAIVPESLTNVATLGLRATWDKDDIRTVQQLLNALSRVMDKKRVSSSKRDKCRFVESDTVYYDQELGRYLIGVEMGTNGVVYLITASEDYVVKVERDEYEE